MELILTSLIKRFWYSDGFYRNKKERFKDFEPSVSFDFRFIRFILEDAEKFSTKSLITLMVIPVLLFYL
jgi:hypothetical protein